MKKIYAIYESVHMNEGKPIAYLSSMNKAIDYIKANIYTDNPIVTQMNDSYYWHNTQVYDKKEMFNKKTIENKRFYIDKIRSTALLIKAINVE